MRRQSAFSLVELVVVIVVLGILSAYALPKFVDLEVEAYRAELKELKGSLESAASLAHEKAVLNNVSPSSDDDGFYNTTIQGETVNLNGNWPSAQENGIIRMLQDLQGLDWDVTNDCVGTGPCIEFYPESVGNKQGCQVAYIFNGTGNEPPSYYLNATDCS